MRYGYIVKCVKVVKDQKSGEVIEVHCTYDPSTRSGSTQSQRKVKGTIHWVSVSHAINAEVRLYDRLFTVENPVGDTWRDFLNPHSLEILRECKVEAGLARAKSQDRFQFERVGYFVVDRDSTSGNHVFNRTVTLRDTWARIEKGAS